MHPENVNILAIESSCDETAAAIVQNGKTVLSNIISSQVEEHKKYGGVVPEIASRRHCENICWVVDGALKEAGLTLDDLTAIAVTYAPASSALFSSASITPRGSVWRRGCR